MSRDTRKPNDASQRAAVERMQDRYRNQLEKQGKLPSQREVETFVKSNAEKADKKQGW